MMNLLTDRAVFEVCFGQGVVYRPAMRELERRRLKFAGDVERDIAARLELREAAEGYCR